MLFNRCHWSPSNRELNAFAHCTSPPTARRNCANSFFPIRINYNLFAITLCGTDVVIQDDIRNLCAIRATLIDFQLNLMKKRNKEFTERENYSLFSYSPIDRHRRQTTERCARVCALRDDEIQTGDRSTQNNFILALLLILLSCARDVPVIVCNVRFGRCWLAYDDADYSLIIDVVLCVILFCVYLFPHTALRWCGDSLMCYFNFFQFLFSFGDECVAHMQRANFVDEIRSVKCRIRAGCLLAVDPAQSRAKERVETLTWTSRTLHLSLSLSEWEAMTTVLATLAIATRTDACSSAIHQQSTCYILVYQTFSLVLIDGGYAEQVRKDVKRMNSPRAIRSHVFAFEEVTFVFQFYKLLTATEWHLNFAVGLTLPFVLISFTRHTHTRSRPAASPVEVS